MKESLNTKKDNEVFELIEKHIETQNINVDLSDKIAKLITLSFDEPYLKKIQLSLYEYQQILKERGRDVDCEITVAADYQIPKVLAGINLIEYEPHLQKKINKMQLIEEKAFRGVTIIVCEYLSK